MHNKINKRIQIYKKKNKFKNMNKYYEKYINSY